MLDSLIIAIGLSIDSFVASVALGSAYRSRITHKIVLGSMVFAAFQADMYLVGWLIGSAFNKGIDTYDHWIAFALLVAVGIKMIYESIYNKHKLRKITSFHVGLLISLAVATSIDALVVGISSAFVGLTLYFNALLIGLVTLLLAVAGAYVGVSIKSFLKTRVGVVGGALLILLAFKILLNL